MIEDGDFTLYNILYRYRLKRFRPYIGNDIHRWFPKYTDNLHKWCGDGNEDGYIYLNFTEEEIVKLWTLLKL